MKEQKFKQHIAAHLKHLRKVKGLSLDATAKLTGVSKAMLGQIERQESSPTIATLWKVANGLETSFSAFFVDPITSKPDQENELRDPNMLIKAIFSYREDTKMEVLEVSLLNRHEQRSDAHHTGMVEHVHVTSGRLSIYFDSIWHDLEEGQSLRFFADQQHAYKALSESATFINIICY